MTDNGGYFVCKTRHLVMAGGSSKVSVYTLLSQSLISGYVTMVSLDYSKACSKLTSQGMEKMTFESSWLSNKGQFAVKMNH